MVRVKKMFLRQTFYAGCITRVEKEKGIVSGKEESCTLGHRPRGFKK